MSYLNVISFLGIFGLCFIAWLFSEHRKVIPWRVIIWGVGLQLVLAFLVFQFPPTRTGLEVFSSLLDGVFLAADTGARFVFGKNIVPVPGEVPPVNLGYIFAFRALPTVIFFSGLMALLYNIGVIQVITEVFAKLFYWTMRLSGAEALSGAANIFVGIEAAIVVKPYLPKMTRSELCAILACCFGTAASSTLAIYVSFLRPVFPNILGHLVSASIIAIPACFVISKILVPETEKPLTLGGIPTEKSVKEIEYFQEHEDKPLPEEAPKLETVGGEPIERVSPLDAAIVGALDGVKMAVAIAAVLILILGLVSLVNQIFGWLGGLPSPIGNVFKVVTLANIQGALFYPLTILTGIPFNETWTASVIIGRRLLETAIPPYQALAEAAKAGLVSPRTVLIVSYALSGFAHLASVGIFVGGTIALIPSRRKDISELGWKALFAGTLATMMIACLAGVFDTGDASILGAQATPAPITTPAVSPTASPPIPSPIPTTSSSFAPTPVPTTVNPTVPGTQTQPQVNPTAAPSVVPPTASTTPTETQNSQQLLDKAKQLLTVNQVSQYNEAIAQARKVPQTDPLYPQAQQDIERWSRIILDVAYGRATQGNYEQAIEAAKLVPPEHAPTYQEAQQLIPQWQKEGVEHKANANVLEKAQGLLGNRQASSYNQAISIARMIQPNQPKYAEAQKLIGEWSQYILDLAKKRASNGNLVSAIKTASLVPENTPASSDAKAAIASWQQQLSKR